MSSHRCRRVRAAVSFRAPARALSQPSCRAEALDRLAAAKPLVLVLDDLHWADSRRRSSCSAHCYAGRRPRRCSWHWRAARQDAGQSRARMERAHHAAALTTLGLGALTPVQARSFLGESVGVAGAAVLYEESGGSRCISSSSPRRATAQVQPARCRDRAERHRDPVRRRCLAERRAGAAVGRRRGCSKARRWRAIGRAGACGGRRCDVEARRWTCGRRAAAAPITVRATDVSMPPAFRDGTRSSSGQSTRTTLAAGGPRAHERCAGTSRRGADGSAARSSRRGATDAPREGAGRPMARCSHRPSGAARGVKMAALLPRGGAAPGRQVEGLRGASPSASGAPRSASLLAWWREAPGRCV